MKNSSSSKLRAHSYRFIAGLLELPLSKEQWQELTGWAKQDIDFGIFKTLIKSINEMDNYEPEKLDADFTRLLRGLAESYGPPPPYEHLYLNPKADVVSQSAVTKIYRSYDANPLDPFGNNSDHLVSQLKFMAHLAIAQEDSSVAPSSLKLIDAQINFLNCHLLSWVGLWLNQIYQQPTHYQLYQNIALSLSHFIRLDLQFLKSSINDG